MCWCLWDYNLRSNTRGAVTKISQALCHGCRREPRWVTLSDNFSFILAIMPPYTGQPLSRWQRPCINITKCTHFPHISPWNACSVPLLQSAALAINITLVLPATPLSSLLIQGGFIPLPQSKLKRRNLVWDSLGFHVSLHTKCWWAFSMHLIAPPQYLSPRQSLSPATQG